LQSNREVLVSARICPECMHTLPVGKVLAYSNEMICENCGKPVEISEGSRYLASFAALIVAIIVWWAASKRYANDSWALAWVLPIVFSYFAFSLVAPIVLALAADLRFRTEQAAPRHEATPTHHPSH
jgi:hypothetical protein